MEHQNFTRLGHRLITVIHLNRKDINPAGHRYLSFVFQEPCNCVHSGVSVKGIGVNCLTHQAIQIQLNRGVTAQVDHKFDGFAVSRDIRPSNRRLQ
jgi:hypothetical protein